MRRILINIILGLFPNRHPWPFGKNRKLDFFERKINLARFQTLTNYVLQCLVRLPCRTTGVLPLGNTPIFAVLLIIFTNYHALAEQIFSWNDGTLEINFTKKNKNSYNLSVQGLPKGKDEALIKNIVDNQLASIVYPDYQSPSSGSFSFGDKRDKFTLDFTSDYNGTSLVVSSNQNNFKTTWQKDGLNISRINGNVKISKTKKEFSKTPNLVLAKRIPKADSKKELKISEKEKPINEDQILTTNEQQLLAINFNSGLDLTFNLWPEWRLSKLSDRFYELTLSKSIISKQELALPYFAPATTDGIIKIIPSQIAENIKVKIEVEKGTELKGTVNNNTLSLIAVKQ